MWLGIQRLVDMIIEFLIKHSSGETTEDKLIRVNASLVLAFTISMWIAIIFGIMLVSAKLDLREYKQSNTAVHDMLIGDESIVKSFIDTNKELNNQVRELQADIIILVKDNHDLINLNKQLLKENLDYQEQCKK